MRPPRTPGLAAPPRPQLPDGPDLLLDGLTMLTTEGYAAGAPMLQRALSAWRDGGVLAGEGFHWLPLACRMSRELRDDQSWSALTARLTGLARHTGALRVLPAALLSGVAVALLIGEGTQAAAMAAEAQAVARATGNPVGPTAR